MKEIQNNFKQIIAIGINLVCFLVLLCLPTKISKGCGPYVDRAFYGYSFLNPNIIDVDAPKAPYFAGFEKIYKQLKPTEDIQQKDNLTEWNERFCNVAKLVDLQFIIYKASLTQMRSLKRAIRKKNSTLPLQLAANTFARHLHQNKCEEAVDYLIFAKRCEPYVMKRSSWNPVQRDTAAMQFLIKDGWREFKKNKSHYFKLRYAYQLIRLAHYKKDYVQTLELYDHLLPKIDNKPSLIEDWIEGHKAGALMGLGRNVEAAYLYSKIFQDTPSKRATAYQSFSIKTEEEWRACLRLCQTDEERATLYALRANDPNSLAVEDMKAIYEMVPQNEHLEFLLVREIQKLEKDLLGGDFNKKKKNNWRYHKIPRKQVGRNLLDLLKFVLVVGAEKKVKTPALWQIAEGYLELLGGDYYAAKNTLGHLRGSIKDEVLAEQLEALIMVANIDGLEEVNTEMEDLIVSYERTELFTKYPDFGKFVKDKLTYLYHEQGFEGKAFLEEHTLTELKYNPQLDLIEALIAICKKEKRSKLENKMVLKSDRVTTIESDLWDLKGTYYLGQMQIESALEAYRQMPRKDRADFGLFNPFRDLPIDCVNCRIIDTAGYNKTVILEQILELEYKAKADMEKAAAYYYQIGNALYNMTYFGYEWEVADYFRSGASWYGLKSGEAVFAAVGAPFGNHETVNCSLPLYYYDKAFRLAKNNELGARAAFMAAKCQQNQFFTSKGSDYSLYDNQIPYVTAEYRQYFNILKDYYSETAFYKEVVEECLYFERYAARN